MVKPPTHINILQPFVGLSSPAGLRGGLTLGLLGNTEKVIAMVTVTVTPLSVQETYTRLNLAQKVYMWKTKKRRREVLQLSRYMMQHLSCNFNSSVSRISLILTNMSHSDTDQYETVQQQMTDPASSPLRSLFLNKNVKDLQTSCRDHLFPVEMHLSKQLQRGGAWYVRVFCIWSWNICMIKFGILTIWWWWWCKDKHAHVHICSTGGSIKPLWPL